MVTPEILKSFGRTVVANPELAALIGGSILGSGVGYLKSAKKPPKWSIEGTPRKKGETDEEYAERAGWTKKQLKKTKRETWKFVGGKPSSNVIGGALSGAVLGGFGARIVRALA